MKESDKNQPDGRSPKLSEDIFPTQTFSQSAMKLSAAIKDFLVRDLFEGFLKLPKGFSRRLLKYVAVLTALAALVTIITGVVSFTGTGYFWWQSLQPWKDRRNIQSIAPGLLLNKISDQLDEQPERIIKEFDLYDYTGRKIPVKDYLFSLDTAYVEVFVDSNRSSRAYAITGSS